MACSSCFNSCCSGCRPGNPVVVCSPFCPTSEEPGLLSEFVVDETTTSPGVINTSALTTVGRVTLSIDDLTDRVWLGATVTWQATGVALAGITLLPVGVGTPAVFRIWRGAPTLPGNTPIYTTIDTTSTLTLTGATTAPALAPTRTTSFSFVDQNPISAVSPQAQFVQYFLTMEPAATGLIGTILTFGVSPISHVFTGAEIEPNNP